MTPRPQPRLGTGKGEKETNGETRARYPEGGCLLLAAPRSSPGKGVSGSGSAATAAATPAVKQPEPPQRLHGSAEARGRFPFGSSAPPPPAFAGREQRSGCAVLETDDPLVPIALYLGVS